MLENREFFLADLLAKTSNRVDARFSLTMPSAAMNIWLQQEVARRLEPGGQLEAGKAPTTV